MAEAKKIQQNKLTVSIPRQLFSQFGNLDIRKDSFRVLIFLLGRLDGERYIIVDLYQIADTLYMSLDTVKEAMIELESYGVVERGSDYYVNNGYRFFIK